MTQCLNGRLGSVFSVRITGEQRARLEQLQSRGGGPRRLGPWLVWSALHRGITDPEGHYPSSGSTSPAGHYPRSARISRAGNTGPGARDGNTPSMASAPPVGERVILDLCAGSGSWSEPYRAAGYPVVRVTLPDCDVRTFEAPARVWGVLAAPPCEQFSLARNGHPEIPRDIERGLEVVGACLRIIQQARPFWWALENPVGLLSRWLGTPRDVWDPCDFGDPWTKRTAIWGDYVIPARGPYVRPLGGGPLCSICDPDRRSTTWCNRADHRAITPAGFARAFMEANP
jgi:hypothetical protein